MSADASSLPRRGRICVLAGPNGAGKSTAATYLLPAFGFRAFVNADDIAKALSEESARPSLAVAAGRVALNRFDALAESGADFAVETTLSGRGLARRLTLQRARGYQVLLIYLWLPSVEIAVERVARRVAAGGHAIPEGEIRRRYGRGLHNLVALYLPLAHRWAIYDNSRGQATLIAVGSEHNVEQIVRPEIWEALQRNA